MARRRWVGLVAAGIVLSAWGVWAQEQATLGGRVVGPDGKAVVGATVRAAYLSGGPDRNYVWAEGETDDAGAFSLAIRATRGIDEYVLIASKAEWAMGLRKGKPGEPVRIEMGRDPVALEGTVTDEQGAPLAGVSVTAQQVVLEEEVGGIPRRVGYWVGRPGTPLSADSDAEGHFAIAGFPAGARVPVTASGPGLADYSPTGPSGPVSEPVAITMLAEARISGRLLRDGQPVAGVRLSADSAGGRHGSGVSGEEGYVIDRLNPGTYTVSADWYHGNIARPRAGLTVAAGQHLTDIDFDLIEGGVIEGQVKLAGTGKPAVGVGIIVRHADIPKCMYGYSTDEDGRYSLRVPPGTLTIEVSQRCRPPAGTTSVNVTVEDGQRVVAEDLFGVPRSESGIVVKDALGAPVSDAQVWLATSAWAWPPLPPAVSDEQGRVTGILEPPVLASGGQPLVFAQKPDQGLVGIAVRSARNPLTEVVLKPGAWLEAQVVDAQGDPLPAGGATVRLTVGGWMYSAPTFYPSDEHGLIRLGPLPTGIAVTPHLGPREAAMALEDWPDEDLEPHPVRLTEGEVVHLPALKLNPDGVRISGTVVDDQGKPISADIVCSATVSLREAKAHADEQGGFELTGLRCRGVLDLIAYTPDGRLAGTVPCDPEIGLVVSLTLEPTGIVSGSVRGADGRPATNVTVHLTPLDVTGRAAAGTPVTLRADVTTDERGEWRIEGLVPGLRYRVYASADAAPIFKSQEFVAMPGPEPVVLDAFTTPTEAP
ncbi:MAG TPA: carboxypeptidase regulatory-like domain-containing protein [Armatimonadota bacterium]|nr:carboxypeptidase regulatory-like domain-containing protein [Armatimonadota bacterium]